MPLVVRDRVKETTTTTGTGTITLAGTSTGFQSFSAVGNGNTTYYAIVDNATGAWETGIGTYTSAGTTLSRDTVLASSNAGSLVNFAAGSKDVFCTYPAGRAVLLDSATNATIPGITLSGGTANGVAYLNGSKVVTSGSVLVFDGADLGINTTPSPWTTFNALDIGAVTSFAGSSTTASVGFNNYWDGTNYIYKTTARAFSYRQTSSGHAWFVANSGTAGNPITFTQGMLLNSSGNFGVGGDPSTVARALLYSAGGLNNFLQLENGSNGGAFHTFKQPNKEYRIGIETNGSLTKTFGIYDVTNNLTDFMASDIGNIGLGLEPSTWGNSGNVQINNNLGFRSTSPNIVSNAYNNTGWYYYATGAAAFYQQSSGQHIWGSAPSGTANTNFTFTQTMLLDTNGDLKINSGYGSVATAYGCRAWVNFNGTGTVAIRGSGNVTSITDNGTGDYTINFTNAMPDTNYSVNASSQYPGSFQGSPMIFTATGPTATAPTTSAFRVLQTLYNSTAGLDVAYMCISVFR